MQIYRNGIDLHIYVFLYIVHIFYIYKCASASTAAPYFVALHLLQLLSCRRLQYTVCDLQIQFCRFLAISPKVLCISCKFLASSLQLLCKFLAKFLAKSLQEFSAGGGKRGKVEPTKAPKSIQNQSASGTRKSTQI